MKCFVTGANGYVGRCLIERLTRQQHEVIGLLHQSTPKKPVNGVTYIKADITDSETFCSYLKDIDVIFHCAAKVSDHGPKKDFYTVNVKGTEQLINASAPYDIKQFIYLSHLPYESSKRKSPYSQTKQIAESVLKKAYQKTGFPVTIIQPGNIYGPGDTTWVTRPINAITQNRLLLVEHGTGIFHHTYIENLLDALLLCIHESKCIGQNLIITDGDNSTTWATYFNDLARILGKKPIQKSISKKTANILGSLMITLLPPFGITPWVSPFAVDILTNTKTYSLRETQQIINYKPKVPYKEAMQQIACWIQNK
jgi:nucleoside-diphosphate-sugar epimerase